MQNDVIIIVTRARARCTFYAHALCMSKRGVNNTKKIQRGALEEDVFLIVCAYIDLMYVNTVTSGGG